jgi:hypothetical protein
MTAIVFTTFQNVSTHKLYPQNIYCCPLHLTKYIVNQTATTLSMGIYQIIMCAQWTCLCPLSQKQNKLDAARQRQHIHSKKVCVRKRSQGFSVVRTQTFVLDYLKNMFIDTNLCGTSAFCVENSKISHKFVSINIFFKLSNTNLCSDNTKSL